jgi:hypothetical protein
MRNKDFLLTFQANGPKIMADEKGKLKMTYEKGKCVKVIGGTHKNKTVWLNAAKPETTESRVNIIVDDAKGERATWTSPRFISSDVIAVTPPARMRMLSFSSSPKQSCWSRRSPLSSQGASLMPRLSIKSASTLTYS